MSDKNISVFTFVPQVIINFLGNNRESSIFGRFMYLFFLKLRDLMVPHYDPNIVYSIGKRKILMPLSHNLPIYVNKYPEYANNLINAVALCSSGKKNFRMIDVGANVGDTAILIRTKLKCKLLCIEPDSRFFDLLKTNTAGEKDIEYEKLFLGDEDGKSGFTLINKNGTAYLRKIQKNDKSIYLQKLDTYLKLMPNFSNAKFIKLDTDGYDYSILKGSEKYLKRAKPVVFFEYDPNTLDAFSTNGGVEVMSFLAKNGYEKALLYDNFGRFILTIDVDDTQTVIDLRNYVINNRTVFFYDALVFHKSDLKLFEKMRRLELKRADERLKH